MVPSSCTFICQALMFRGRACSAVKGAVPGFMLDIHESPDPKTTAQALSASSPHLWHVYHTPHELAEWQNSLS